MKSSIEKYEKKEMFKRGVVAGIGWAIGVTLGFALVSALLVLIAKALGEVPSIGDFFASIVESTQESLLNRNPLIPQ